MVSRMCKQNMKRQMTKYRHKILGVAMQTQQGEGVKMDSAKQGVDA